MMLLVTLPKNGKLAPTRSAATIASASSINPISVSDPIHPLILCNASMCVLPIRQEAPADTHATHASCDNLRHHRSSKRQLFKQDAKSSTSTRDSPRIYRHIDRHGAWG